MFILYSHGLFARGVQSLLAKEGEVEVVGTERDDRHALDTLKALNPDVILVDSGAPRGESRLTIAEILQDVPQARVISLSIDENGMDIYDRQRMVAAGPADLVRAIRRGVAEAS